MPQRDWHALLTTCMPVAAWEPMQGWCPTCWLICLVSEVCWVVSKLLDVLTAASGLQVAVPPGCWMSYAAKVGCAVMRTGETARLFASYSTADYLTVLYLMAPKMPIRVYSKKPISPTVNPMPPIMTQRSQTQLQKTSVNSPWSGRTCSPDCLMKKQSYPWGCFANHTRYISLFIGR